MRLDSYEKFVFKEWSNIFLRNVWGCRILTTVGTWGVSIQLQLTNISISILGRNSRISQGRGTWRRGHHFPLPNSYYLKNEVVDSFKTLLIGERSNRYLPNFAAWWIIRQIPPKFCYWQKCVTVPPQQSYLHPSCTVPLFAKQTPGSVWIRITN